MKALTRKQQRFAEEYLVDLNATQAAIRAGYSAKTAEQQGPRLLGNVGVADAIAAGQKRLAAKIGRTVASVMADIGRVRDDAMRIITDEEKGVTRMLSHKDALKALELEARHLGAFEDRHVHRVEGLDWTGLLSTSASGETPATAGGTDGK